MFRSTVDIQSVAAEIRQGLKRDRRRRKKSQGKNIMSASATQGGHKNGNYTSCRGLIWCWIFGRSIIAAKLRQPEVASRWIFLCENFTFFWKNYPLRQKFLNSVRKEFTDGRVVCKFSEIWQMEIGEIVYCLREKKTTKFRLALPLLLLCSSRSVARTSPGQCTHPNRFTFSGVIRRKVNPIFSWSLASSRTKRLLTSTYGKCHT